MSQNAKEDLSTIRELNIEIMQDGSLCCLNGLWKKQAFMGIELQDTSGDTSGDTSKSSGGGSGDLGKLMGMGFGMVVLLLCVVLCAIIGIIWCCIACCRRQDVHIHEHHHDVELETHHEEGIVC